MEKISEIKRHLVDANDSSNEELKSAWNEGFLCGLAYGSFIDSKEEEELFSWIKSDPILETKDGYGTFVDENGCDD